MRPNMIKTKVAEGKPVLNGWLHLSNSYAAEIMAHAGFDSLTIDLQHGPIDFDACFGMLQAISTTNTVPMVRVPWNDPAAIMRVLDAGAYGIICPMINTAAEAKAFVSAGRYAPQGSRSFGANRAVLYSGADYWKQANEDILLFAMIETTTALENLEEILAVPGLNGTYIGPTDLGLSMGKAPILNPTDPSVLAAIERIRTRSQARNLIAGVHTDGPKTTRQRLSEGFNLTTVGADSRLLGAAAQAALQDVRGSDAAPPKASAGY